MRFSTSIIAAFGLLNLANAHVLMVSPTPFAAASLDNAPLFPDGSNYPCKNPDYSSGTATDIEQGAEKMVLLRGSAVHGGGSCQVSITYDNPPTKDSVWKVIHSVEGGCPLAGVPGNNGDNAAAEIPQGIKYTIPTGLQTGPAVLAWTWFNKVGNREMYMNCAPINIQGQGSAKRSPSEEFEGRLAAKLAARQQSSFSSLPDMFKANIGNGCATKEGTDLEFPNPGASLELKQVVGLVALGPPVGSGCGAAGTAPVNTPNADAATPTTGAGEFIQDGQETPSPVQGDVSGAVPTRAAENKPAESAVAPAGPSQEPEYDAPAQPEQANQPEAPAQNETAPAPEIPTVGGSAIAPGTPCPADEGQWNCIDGTSFQRCASGQWSVVQGIAAGTTCSSGISSSIKIVSMPGAKREVRFSNAHVRRHINARSI